MKEFDKEKIKNVFKAIDEVCLHCKKCDETKCPIYNAYGEIEKLK